MSERQSLYGSTIGKKAVMALTGLILFGFTIGHMAGNLLVFLGPDAINAYAQGLKDTPPLLWGTRLTLLAAIPTHIVTAVALTRATLAARPVAYQQQQHQATSYAARTMRYGGLWLMFFVVFHLAHYTWFLFNPEYATLVDGQGRHDVYRMVIAGFSQPVLAIAYVVTMVALGLHLSHGAWSMLQSLGLNHPRFNAYRNKIALTFATLLAAGFSAVPIAVLTGIVK